MLDGLFGASKFRILLMVAGFETELKGKIFRQKPEARTQGQKVGESAKPLSSASFVKERDALWLFSP